MFGEQNRQATRTRANIGHAGEFWHRPATRRPNCSRMISRKIAAGDDDPLVDVKTFVAQPRFAALDRQPGTRSTTPAMERGLSSARSGSGYAPLQNRRIAS